MNNLTECEQLNRIYQLLTGGGGLGESSEEPKLADVDELLSDDMTLLKNDQN